MVRIVYIETRSGAVHTATVEAGESVMQAAVDHGVPGIDGDCGGACACGTCHVHIGDRWRDRVGPPFDHEVAMLECAEDVQPCSRLACQIEVTEALDGLVVYVP